MKHSINKSGVRVASEFPPNYKEQRLEAWGNIAFHFLDYIRDDNFHLKVHGLLCDIICKHLLHYGPPSPALIDLGCGPGYFVQALKQDIQITWARLVALDFCTKMVNT